MTELLPYQRIGVDGMHGFKGRVLLADSMGLGKAQPLNAKILTPTGFKTMGQMEVGDEVIGSDGKPHRVLGVYPQGIKKVFRVTFSDGSSTRCCDDHLWSVNTSSRRHCGSPNKVLPLSEIRKRLFYQNGNVIWFIPMMKPAELCFSMDAEIVDGYLLGYLIANGCLTKNTPYVTCPDNETVCRLKKLLDGVNMVCTTIGGIDYRLVGIGSQSDANPLTVRLRELGLMGKYSYEKSIPNGYLFSSERDRRRLLQGLMDGDGSVTAADNHLEYSTASSKLAEDVVFLVRSLGGIARIGIKKEPKYTYKGEKKIGRPSYRVSIALPVGINPFLLSRKASVYHPRSKYQPTRSIVSVKEAGKQKCQCISIDSPDQLYVTDDFIVTHNTIQAISFLSENDEWPAIVICPAALKLHWSRELKKHYNLDSTILYGQSPIWPKSYNKKRIFIINYDILEEWLPFLRRTGVKVVVADEGHLLGNINSKRTRCWRLLCKNVKKVIVLTGTPITNRPWELFPILNVLLPKKFASSFSYGIEYCEAGRSFGKWQFSGAKKLGQLHDILRKNVMIRRTKEEVLKDLPPMRRFVLPLEIENREEYERAEKDVVAWLAETDVAAARRAEKAERYTRFSHLKKLAANLKMKAVREWIDNLLENTDGKVLLGAWHTAIIESLHERYKALSVVIDGSKNEKQRDEAERSFQTDPKCRALVGQIKACGLGLNLTAAGTVGILELPWNPGTCQQFQARPHRLTSTQPVDVYYLVAADTIEEKLCEIIQRKQRISDQALDGVKVQDSSLTLFDELALAMSKKKVKK